MGVEGLDLRLAGGFERPSCLLFFSENLAEKRTFAEQFTIAGIHDGETCLYFDFYRAPQLMRAELHKFGPFDETRLILVDGTSCQNMVLSSEKYQLRETEDLDHVETVMIQALRESRASRTVLDSLEFLTERFPMEQVVDFLSKLMSEVRKQNGVLALLFANWSSSTEEIKVLRNMANYVLEFKTVLRGGVLLNSVRIGHNQNGKSDAKWIAFAFKDKRGLVAYFPRVLVTGPPSAGKSTLMRRLCGIGPSIDPTLGLDCAKVEVAGADTELYCTPSEGGPELITKALNLGINGILLLVDSSNPSSLGLAREWRKLIREDLPMVVAANKVDVPEALSAPEIRRLLGLGPGAPVISISGKSGRGVDEALRILVGLITGAGP